MRTTITPNQAKWLLKANTINRKAKASSVLFLTNEILAGRWAYNGESIIVATDGTLLDGQHRLMACVEADMPIDVEFVENVSIDVMPTIDTGTARGASDVFAIRGINGHTNIASGVRNILEGITTKKRRKSNKTYKISNQELLDFYDEHSVSLDIIGSFARHLYQTGASIIQPAHIMAFIYLLEHESVDDNIYKFFREVMTGVIIGESNMAQKLRTVLINDKISKSTMTVSNKVKLIIKAFRSYNRGLSRSRVMVGRDEVVYFDDIDFSITPNFNLRYMEVHSKGN